MNNLTNHLMDTISTLTKYQKNIGSPLYYITQCENNDQTKTITPLSLKHDNIMLYKIADMQNISNSDLNVLHNTKHMCVNTNNMPSMAQLVLNDETTFIVSLYFEEI